MIGIGVAGYGYWGPKLVRNFYELPNADLVKVSDLRSERLEKAQAHYPTVKVTQDYRELLTDSRIDAIAIATPISTHFELAMKALKAGKHLLVEKPLTSNSEQAVRLIEEANRRNLTLMVDHTFVYTGAVQRIQELLVNKELGDIYYYDSVRVNLGLFQHDVNVMWDLAVHDLSIMDYLLPSKPVAVSATGISHVPGEPENIAYLTLFFEENLIAHIHVNWLAPVKVRRTLIGGSQQMILYDDIEPSEKIKVYNKGITIDNKNEEESVYQMLIGYRTGDMLAPQLSTTEALRTEALHFINCIEKAQPPLTDGEVGLRVVEILESATKSMKERGSLVKVKTGREIK